MLPFEPNFSAMATNSFSTWVPKSLWIMNAISSISWLITPAISSTKRCTIGFPAMGINGLGTVSVWGRNLDPRPAMGTIIFIRVDFRAQSSQTLPYLTSYLLLIVRLF